MSLGERAAALSPARVVLVLQSWPCLPPARPCTAAQLGPSPGPPALTLRPSRSGPSAPRTMLPPAQELLLSLPPEDWSDEEQARRNAFLTGRSSNLGTVKPGAKSIMLQVWRPGRPAACWPPVLLQFTWLLERLLGLALGCHREEGRREGQKHPAAPLPPLPRVPHVRPALHAEQTRPAPRPPRPLRRAHGQPAAVPPPAAAPNSVLGP